MEQSIEEKLFPYQKKGIDLIVNHYRDVLLADHPGAGKTCQAIIAADRLLAKRILVVCPASLRENWKREFEIWSNQRRNIFPVYSSKDFNKIAPSNVLTNYVIIISYDLVSDMSLGEAENCDLLIFDESHYLKNWKSKRTKRCLKELWPKAKKRIAITGTPLPNGRAIEGFSLFSRMLPGTLGNWKTFTDTYCVKEITPWGVQYTRSKNLTALGDLARKHFMIRRKREDTIGQLPPLVRMQIPLSVDTEVSSNEDINEALSILETGKITPHMATKRRHLGASKIQEAVAYIKELFDSGETENAVVFCHHHEVIEGVYIKLCAENLKTILVDGETGPIMRQQAIDEFQAGKYQIFLGSLLATNTGITLTKAHDVVFVEADWVPSNNEQAEGRCYRIGQKHITRSHYLVVPDTIDDSVTAAVIKKQKDITTVLGC